jgi:hypothetical protein
MEHGIVIVLRSDRHFESELNYSLGPLDPQSALWLVVPSPPSAEVDAGPSSTLRLSWSNMRCCSADVALRCKWLQPFLISVQLLLGELYDLWCNNRCVLIARQLSHGCADHTSDFALGLFQYVE